VSQPGGLPAAVPGIDLASGVSPGASADEVFYTIGGDTRVFHRVLSAGEMSLAHDFGPPASRATCASSDGPAGAPPDSAGAGGRGGVYGDVRNLLNRRNIVAVRRIPVSRSPTMGRSPGSSRRPTRPIPKPSLASRPGTEPERISTTTAWSKAERSCCRSIFPPTARDYSQPIFA
jgi:hypothetical protein